MTARKLSDSERKESSEQINESTEAQIRTQSQSSEKESSSKEQTPKHVQKESKISEVATESTSGGTLTASNPKTTTSESNSKATVSVSPNSNAAQERTAMKRSDSGTEVIAGTQSSEPTLARPENTTSVTEINVNTSNTNVPIAQKSKGRFCVKTVADQREVNLNFTPSPEVVTERPKTPTFPNGNSESNKPQEVSSQTKNPATEFRTSNITDNSVNSRLQEEHSIVGNRDAASSLRNSVSNKVVASATAFSHPASSHSAAEHRHSPELSERNSAGTAVLSKSNSCEDQPATSLETLNNRPKSASPEAKSDFIVPPPLEFTESPSKVVNRLKDQPERPYSADGVRMHSETNHQVHYSMAQSGDLIQTQALKTSSISNFQSSYYISYDSMSQSDASSVSGSLPGSPGITPCLTPSSSFENLPALLNATGNASDVSKGNRSGPGTSSQHNYVSICQYLRFRIIFCVITGSPRN